MSATAKAVLCVVAALAVGAAVCGGLVTLLGWLPERSRSAELERAGRDAETKRLEAEAANRLVADALEAEIGRSTNLANRLVDAERRSRELEAAKREVDERYGRLVAELGRITSGVGAVADGLVGDIEIAERIRQEADRSYSIIEAIRAEAGEPDNAP